MTLLESPIRPNSAATTNGSVGEVEPAPAPSAPSPAGDRTIWGLDPVQLHTRYWASHGVQVVRQGEPSEIVKHAELYLLTDPGTLTLFKLGHLMEALNWVKPTVLFVRLHDARERGYRENAITDDVGRFVRFQRVYDAASSMTRIALTPDREVAQLWQSAPDPAQAWRRLRRFARRTHRATRSLTGNVYDRADGREVAFFIHDLVQTWKHPDTTVLRARPVRPTLKRGGSNAKFQNDSVWRDAQSHVEPGVQFIGPVWIGSGRTVTPEAVGGTIVGPTVLWDAPDRRPVNDVIHWLQIEPKEPPPEPAVKDASPLDRGAKRAFDIVAALIGLAVFSPLWPIIMFFIWLEDGRPFFFGHVRETVGAEEFKCWKFRSMRKDAEKMKEKLVKENQADGPQFFMENDPRLTRIGRLIRKYNFDEFPQFWNVLMGEMSIVGPRPSPRKENQFCPPWREARLSVRPGITGLWQVKRTRKAGADFQEWIKYDIEYVERRTFWLDIVIIWKTVAQIFGKLSRN